MSDLLESESRRRCWSCGAKVLPSTASRNFGRCRPCAKKGWYGRLWEIITGTSRQRRPIILGPAADAFRKALGLPSSPDRSLSALFSDLDTSHGAASIDWRSAPDEVFGSLRKLSHWSEPTQPVLEERADLLVSALARHHERTNLRFLNLTPGSDGWVVVIASAPEVRRLQRLAVEAGLSRPEAL